MPSAGASPGVRGSETKPPTPSAHDPEPSGQSGHRQQAALEQQAAEDLKKHKTAGENALHVNTAADTNDAVNAGKAAANAWPGAAADPGAGAQPGAAAPEGGDNAGIAAQLADAAQTLTASAQSFDLGSVLQPYFAGVDAFATSATSSIEAVNTAALTSQQNLAALKQRLDNLPDPNADDADISGTGASAR